MFHSTSTTTLILILATLAAMNTEPAMGAPVGKRGDAYTGSGGSANGGSVTSLSDGVLNLNALNFGSYNGGNGGDASSGKALGLGGLRRGDAYTGSGGSANGGSVSSISNGLLNLNALNFGSYNGGKGGDASSGNAVAGLLGKRGDAYTGAGGSANGGSVISSDSSPSYNHGLLDLGDKDLLDLRSIDLLDLGDDDLPDTNALNFDSYNGGNGGKASSGNAISSGDGSAYSGAGGQANGGSVSTRNLPDIGGHDDLLDVVGGGSVIANVAATVGLAGGTHHGLLHVRDFGRRLSDVLEVTGSGNLVTDVVATTGTSRQGRPLDVRDFARKSTAPLFKATISTSASGSASVGPWHRRNILDLNRVIGSSSTSSGPLLGSEPARNGILGTKSGSLVDGSLLNADSYNGGNGGDASSGNAFAA